MKRGYSRISHPSQNAGRQIESLKKFGCEVIYQDKASGKDTNRPEFQKLMKEVQPLDIIVIHSLDRFSRSAQDLLLTCSLLKEKRVYLKSIQDTWLDTTKENIFSDVLLTIFGALAEHERHMIKLRQKEGIKIAKCNGVKFGRPKKISKHNKKLMHAIDLYNKKDKTIKEICEVTGVSKSTLYRAINEFNIS